MLNDRVRQVAVVFSVVTLIVMNYLSNVRAFGGSTNGEISDKYSTLITPAGWAFSIWGLIFLGLLAFAVYQALPSQRTNPRFRNAGWWVVINGLLNAIWSPLFNNERIGTAFLVILAMLFSLMMVLEALRIPQRESVGTAETWLARVPFAIYFGWLTVATILNLTVYLKATEFDLSILSEPVWGAGVLVIGWAVGAFLFNRYRTAAYFGVFAWAYAAIAAKQRSVALVPMVAWVGAAAVVLLLVKFYLGRRITE